MATIYTAPQQQPQLTAQAAQYQPPGSSQVRDPLFEALARYITSGPGASSVSTSEIQDIIDGHVNQDGGRAYLESIVMPDPDFPRIFDNPSMADGTLNTIPGTFGLTFTAKGGPMSMLVIKFTGQADGFFPMDMKYFNNAKFYWNNTLRGHGPVSFTVRCPRGQTIVEFRPEVEPTVMPRPPALAELIIDGMTHMPPNGATGRGKFEIAE